MTEYPCPRCGQLTTGSWSEGGCRWAICEDCHERDRLDARLERERLDRYDKLKGKKP